MSAPFLCFQKAFVFVCGGAADIAHSRQFADVQLPVFVGGIVPQKGGGDVLFAYLRPPLFLTYPDRCDNIAAMGLCVFRYAATATHFLLLQKEGTDNKKNNFPALGICTVSFPVCLRWWK